MKNIDNWAKEVAATWKTHCPEIVEIILNDANYVFHFLPPVKRFFAIGPISTERATEIENITIDILNKYYTQQVRAKLKP